MSKLNRIPCTPQGYIATCAIGDGSLTFAVKDSLDVAGYPTRAGSLALENAPPAACHARVIAQLLAAGCRLTGKTTLHELAFGVTGINPGAGTPVNSLYPHLIPGGSSSGSATVVASGCVDFAIGTDTGGSVRMPAACCGVMGLKPGFGRVSRAGVLPAASSLDCVGFFTRDLATLGEVLARLGLDDAAPQNPALTPAFLSGLALPEIDSLLLKRLGDDVETAVLPGLEAAHEAGLYLIGYENWQAFSGLCDHPALLPDVRQRIARGAEITPQMLARAEAVRADFSREVDTLLERHGLLLLPALPALPPTLEEARDPLTAVTLTRLLRPFNLSGHPALTIPAGEIDGRPVALQIVAAKGQEAALVRAAGRWFHHR
jgi:amidase